MTQPLIVQIRDAQATDLEVIRALYANTVRLVNSRDYSPEQIEVWTSGAKDEPLWRSRLQNHRCFVAEIAGVIVGFTTLESDGHIDLFYCHHAYQGQGIGSQLLQHLEAIAHTLGIQSLYTEASITAKPFFQRQGFDVVAEEIVERQGLPFRRYRMKKSRPTFYTQES